jgi:RNA polymerase subunit RPABC4/transcription elongation factor Spt4
MPTTKCSSCKKALTKSAKYCPSCGVAQKWKDALFIEDDVLRQKVEKRMQNLEKSLNKFHSKFVDVEVDSLIEEGELEEFVEEVSKISKKLGRLSKYGKQEGIDIDALVLKNPDLARAIEKLNEAISILNDDVPRILEKLKDVEEGPSESVGIPALKFHIFFWSASLLVSAIPSSYITYTYFNEQQWVFVVGMVLGLFISYRVFRNYFIQCPHCALYIGRNQALVKTKTLGSQDGWHTESEEVETFHSDGFGQPPSRSSTTYINRSVPHRDYYYENILKCYSCDKKFSEKFSNRVDM